eukprot:g1332.t1
MNDHSDKKRRKQEYTFLENSVAGAIAGFVGEVLLHPFDTISTRLKVQPSNVSAISGIHTVLVKDGIRGLFAGVSATLLASIPSSAIYFATYESVKTSGITLAPDCPMPIIHACAGLSSELFSSIVTVPCEVVKCRLQLGSDPAKVSGGWTNFHLNKIAKGNSSIQKKNYSGVFDALLSVTRREGLRGLYSGYGPCLITDCTYSALQFVLYEKLKKILQKKRNIYESENATLQVQDTLFVGAVSGGIAGALSNPLDVITTRLMVQGEKKVYRNAVHCCMSMLKKEGPQSLLRGLIPRVIHIAPMASITFAVYEQIKSRFFSETENEEFVYSQLRRRTSRWNSER